MPKPRRMTHVAAAMFAAALLGACATAPPPDSPGAAPGLNETQAGGPSRWELVRWQQADGTLKSIPHGDNGEPVIFEFNAGIDAAQGTVSAYAGCNRFSGSYGKTENGMRFDRIASTRRACPGPGMAVENALLRAMQQPFITIGTQPSAAANARQIVWKTADGDLLHFVEREGVGRRADRLEGKATTGGVEKLVYVDGQRVPCQGVASQTCYRVRDNPDGPWQLWYGPIEGLDFEPGVAYTLRVREARVPGPPADASAIRWELLEVVKRVRAG